MASLKQDSSQAQIAQELIQQASDLWGKSRAEDIQVQLQETAANLWQIRTHPVKPDVEPSFYQYP